MSASNLKVNTASRLVPAFSLGDVSSRVRSIISLSVKGPAQALFPALDRVSVEFGLPPQSCHEGRLVQDSFDARLSTVYDLTDSFGETDCPVAIRSARTFCDMTYVGDDGSLDDLAMKMKFKLIQAKILDRFLSANQRERFFTSADFISAARNDRYTEFLSYVHAVQHKEIFGLDERGAAVAGLTAMLIGYNRMIKPDDDGMSVLFSVLGKHSGLAEEYRAYRDLFCEMFVAKLKSSAAQACQDAFRTAGKYLFDNRQVIIESPYSKWDTDMRGCAEVVTKEFGHYSAMISAKHGNKSLWFLIADPLSFQVLDPAVPVIVREKAPAKTEDLGEKAVAEIRKEIPDCDKFIPGITKLKVANRAPDASELSRVTKDPFNNDELIIEFDERTGDGGKVYPLSVRSVKLFCPSVRDKFIMQYPEMLTRAIAKAIQISIIDRLIAPNAKRDHLTREELDAVLRSDGYVNLLSYILMIANKEKIGLDEAVSGVVAMAVATLGISGFTAMNERQGSVFAMRRAMKEIPYYGEELRAYADALMNHFLVPGAKVPQNMVYGNRLGTAVVQNLQQTSWMTSKWENVDGRTRENLGLVAGAVENCVSFISNGSLTPHGWMISPAANGRLIPVIPEEISERMPGSRDVLSADSILGRLKDGIMRKDNYFVARQAFQAIEDLKIFGGRPGRWFIPGIAELKTEPEHAQKADSDRSLAAQLARKLKEDADRSIRAGAKELCLDSDGALHSYSRLIEDSEASREFAAGLLAGDDHDMAAEAAYILLMRGRESGGKTIQSAIVQRTIKGRSLYGIANGVLKFLREVASGSPERMRTVLQDSGINFIPVIDSLLMSVSGIGEKASAAQIEAAKTLSGLPELNRMTGMLEGLNGRLEKVESSYIGAVTKLALEFATTVDFEKRGDRTRLASAVAQLGSCTDDLQDRLFEELFNNLNMSDLWFDTGKVRNCADGIRAQLKTEGSGFRERLWDFINRNASDHEQAEKVLFAVHCLSYKRIETGSFDLGSASERELAGILTSAGVQDPARMARLINRAGVKSVAEFERTKVNGLGQNRAKITDALKAADIGTSLRRVLITGLTSENPLIVSMAVQAAGWLRNGGGK